MLEGTEALPECKCLQIGNRSKIARSMETGKEKERVNVGEQIAQRPERLDEDDGNRGGKCADQQRPFDDHSAYFPNRLCG